MEQKAVSLATITIALLLASAGVALAATITCEVGGCTGTNHNDKMFGTVGFDLMDGGGGNDRMYGLGGDDIMFGDAGKDRVDGGAGEDFVFGYSGRDTLVGGSGNDQLDAVECETTQNCSPGPDTISAGDGHDVILAENGKIDRIECGAGDDIALVDSTDRVSSDCELIA